MTIGGVKKPLSTGFKLAGILFAVFGVAVWLWWRPYPRAQGVVRIEKTLVRGEEVLKPVVYPVEPGQPWIADPSPLSLPSRYKQGDIVTVLLLPKSAVVKPTVSVWKSPLTDFVIGAVLLAVGWRFDRRARVGLEGPHVQEPAV